MTTPLNSGEVSVETCGLKWITMWRRHTPVMLSSLFAAAVFVACQSSSSAPTASQPNDKRRDPVDSVILTPQFMGGSPGVSGGITSSLQSAIPRHDLSPVGRVFVWSASNPTVVRIEPGPSNAEGSNGPWTAVATIIGVGQSTITLTVEGKSGSMTLLSTSKP